MALASLGVVVLALVALLLVRASWPSSEPAPNARVDARGSVRGPDELADERAVAEHLAQAIRFQTVSHQQESADDRSVFAAFRAFLQAAYPRAHSAFTRELVSGDGLLYHWQGSDPSLAPILFLAHQDVVPIEAATAGKWTHAPFAGEIAEGFVWGRGAIDDKGPLICLFEAFESLLAEGFTPARSIWFASGFDEEVGGSRGAQEISRELARRGIRFAWVLDEGGAITQDIIPFISRPVAGIAVAEKGYLSLELIAHGEGGHSSMPPPDGAITALLAALTRLQKQQFAPRLTPMLREGMASLAPDLSFWPRLVAANLWLTAPAVARALADRKETSPLVQTTIAPTILEAGVKENVVPATARAVVNFRILPGDSIAKVTDHVRRAIDDPRVELRALTRTRSEPAPLSNVDGLGYRVLVATVRKLFPEAVVVPGVVNGATDARHFQAVATDVYRFTPRLLRKSDMKRIHGIDERAGVRDLALAVRAYREIVRQGAGAQGLGVVSERASK